MDQEFEAWVHARGPSLARSALLVADPFNESAGTRLYTINSDIPGSISQTLRPVPAAPYGCSPSWTSSELYLPTMSMHDDAAGAAAILVNADGEATINADPRLNIVCATWSRSALEGDSHESWGSRIFGQDNTWPSWHWRELSLSVLRGIGLIAGAVLTRRRWYKRVGDQPRRPAATDS